MRDYKKPYIEDEEIELEDVIAMSGQTEGNDDNAQQDNPDNWIFN